MAGKRKQKPIEIFELTIEDAERLVAIVEAMTNTRKYAMRREMRTKIGEALRVPASRRDQLDCLESADLYVVFKPGSRLRRDDFTDPRPMLRQAIVAACAAFETYLADKAMSKVGPLLKGESSLTPRLRELTLTLADWMLIDESYSRPGWGLRGYVVEPAVREMASTAPSKVGELLSMLGVDKWTRKVDDARAVDRGQTEDELKAITERRNRIAHDADRIGRGRAHLTVDEVCDDIAALRSIVKAIEAVL